MVGLLAPQLSGASILDLPGKSIVPLLSASTSLIMSCNSDSLGFWPKERITVPSSFVVICPVAYCQSLHREQKVRIEYCIEGVVENFTGKTDHLRPCPK